MTQLRTPAGSGLDATEDQISPSHEDRADRMLRLFSPPVVRSRTIICIGSPDEVREQLEVLLRKRYQVQGFCESIEALERIAQERPDVIFLLEDALTNIPVYRRVSPISSIVAWSDRPFAIDRGADLRMSPSQVHDPESFDCLEELLCADAFDPTYVELAFITHEIGNSLSVIETYADLVVAETQHRKVNDYALKIHRASELLRQTLNSVVDVRRATLGMFNLDIQSCALLPYIEHFLSLFQDTSQEHAFVFRGVDVTARIDRLRIAQVLTNLLNNAIKYSPKDTTITIELSCNDDEAVISVCDEGPGIPANLRDKLFHRFSRLDTATSGMGIGLYISRELVRQHGGDLELTSADDGCCFSIRLPLSSTHVL